MVTVKFKKKYKHTETRTWEKGDTPTVSKELADKLVKGKYAVVIATGDTRRGIDEKEEEKISEAQNKEQ